MKKWKKFHETEILLSYGKEDINFTYSEQD